MRQIEMVTGGELVALPQSSVGAVSAVERHPAAVYLARLAPSGRRTQATALATIAMLASRGQAGVATLPWEQLTYAHTQALRTLLADRYAPATAN